MVHWSEDQRCERHYITLHYITLHYRHFKRHLHLKWPVVHQQLHVIRNTAHRPSTQASYTASRVRPKRKISCAAAQITATLTISFPRWRHMSLTSWQARHWYTVGRQVLRSQTVDRLEAKLELHSWLDAQPVMLISHRCGNGRATGKS